MRFFSRASGPAHAPRPHRWRHVLRQAVATALAAGLTTGAAAAADHPAGGRAFDLQAHRGGVAMTVENTLPAFARALELGVTTLELDVQITEDGHAVVTHDRDVQERNCRDTGPAFPGDPEYPYVPGKRYVKDLTLAQIRTLDCGSLRQARFPDQRLAPGARMPLLSEVYTLVRSYRAHRVGLNVEAKVEAGAPQETAPRERFVRTLIAETRRARMLRQVTVQSFDWGALARVRELEPRLPLVALTNGQQFLQQGQPGASPWLGGLDIDDFEGSLQRRYVTAAASLGADAVSPVHGDPQNGGVEDPGYTPFTNRELVAEAHRRGLKVVPWTVDDPATVRHLLGVGVDGLITDAPDMVRGVLADEGYRLPRAYTPKR
ncbi:glycerophosphodiester phosphodiesterase family protein [Streptomyces sp. NPDC056600]|uniref:glycerophosphodiester phosphodiesterase family protein n=1 Tax=Streptomyces sp. NPDC056600 TaxID=3345874 RepID=UPI0036C45101